MDATFVDDENLRGRIERTLADIDNEDSRQAVFDHLEERAANGDKDETLRNTTNALRNVANFLDEEFGLSFQEVRPQTHKVPDIDPETGDEVERVRVTAAKELIAWQSTADLAKSTLSSRRDILRSFYASLRKSPKNEYPPEVATLPTVSQSQDSTPTDRLIPPAELKQMLDAHDHPRDRAILAVLYEAGLRRGEMVSLALENVEFDQYGAVVVLPKHATDLKTGSRRVRILDAEPYLRQWIESHPAKDDPSAPLFITRRSNAYGQPLTKKGLASFIEEGVRRRAGIKKKLSCHDFRHTAVTEKARQGWTEAEMRAYFGWKRDSPMPSRYTHLSGRDMDDKMLERYGKKERDPASERALKPRECPACGAENAPTNMFCKPCSHPLSPMAEEKIQKRRVEDLMDAMRDTESFKEMLASEVRRHLEGTG